MTGGNMDVIYLLVMVILVGEEVPHPNKRQMLTRNFKLLICIGAYRVWDVVELVVWCQCAHRCPNTGGQGLKAVERACSCWNRCSNA